MVQAAILTAANLLDPRAVRALRRISAVAAAAALVAGGAALASYPIGAPWLRRALSTIEVQPNTAVGLSVAAASLLLYLSGARWAVPLARALAAATAAIGAATLAEHVGGVDLGIDTLIVPHMARAPGTTSRGRMGPPAALNLFALGIAMMLLRSRAPRRARTAQAIALGISAVPLIAAVGYAYRVAVLFEQPRFTAVALPTVAALLLLDVGVLLARPGEGFVSILVTDGAASTVARRVLASTVPLPVAVGFAALVWAGGGPGGEAALAVSFVVVGLTLGLVVLVLADAAAIGRMESAKLRAQAEREASREELAEALRRERDARAGAESASRAKDLFLATLSHELRTPLNAIVGWSRLLHDVPGDAVRLARGLSAIERNGRALAQHVADLLDMSHLASGKLRLDPAEVDLGAVVERAVEAVRPSAEARGVSLALARPTEAPRVLGDAGRLQQVAWNLLSNAVKFSSLGGRVDVRISCDETSRAVLEVSDSGAGIAPELLPRIFDTFVQGDGSAARRHGGLGLGLSVTRALVRLHGGDIEAASAGPGRGATFTVRVPELSVKQTRPKSPRMGLVGARILVVEDEEDSRELLLQLLKSWGARASGAASARDALAASARERPDVVLSDIAMPGEDGYALVAELRRRERDDGGGHLPAAALTAFTRPEDRRRVLAAGFDAHVAKPIDPAVLRDALESLLGRASRPTPVVSA